MVFDPLEDNLVFGKCYRHIVLMKFDANVANSIMYHSMKSNIRNCNSTL